MDFPVRMALPERYRGARADEAGTAGHEDALARRIA
jgi:hypothetical protein